MKNWKNVIGNCVLGTSLVFSSIITGTVDAQEKISGKKTQSFDIESRLDSRFLKPGHLEQSQKHKLSDNTLVIKYHSPLTSTEHKQAGGVLQKRINSLGYDVIKLAKNKKISEVLKAYQKLDKVASVVQSAPYETYGTGDPKNFAMYQLETMKVNEASKLAGNHSVTVAVVDTGIDTNHPDLKNQLLPSYNVPNPMNPANPMDHGTHVAGIIASTKDNGIGGQGINPKAKILPIDVADRFMMSDFFIAEGIIYAVNHGAKVINLSLGSPYPSPILEDAIYYAISHNVTVVAAAGNDGMEMYNYPASFEGVISVGATNKDNKLADFSTYGPSLDVVGPGEQIYSTLYSGEKKSSYGKMDGTSMASPVVAGVASLLLSKYPNLTPYQVEYILEKTAIDLGVKGFDTRYGNGLVDPVAALKFDINSIPKVQPKPLTKKSILNAAKPINLVKPYKTDGTLSLPSEEQWYKFDVQADTYIQTTLKGMELYDLAYKLYFYPNKGFARELKVNYGKQGKTEANLYKVPEDGVIAIGISDVNENYNKEQNKYTLEVEKFDQLLEDDNTLENPTLVSKLPFKVTDSNQAPYYLSGEEGDSDYFNVNVDEQQLIKAKVHSIPGVDVSLNLYEKVALESDSQLDELIDVVNNNNIGETETITFQAEAGKEYLIEVTNLPTFDEEYFDFMDFMFIEYFEPFSSHHPYELVIDGKQLPADEDGYPAGINGSEEEEAYDEEDYYKEEDYGFDFSMIAQPHEIGKDTEGYIQFSGDEDYYSINVEQNGIYEFEGNYDKGSDSSYPPYVEILLKDEESGEIYPIASNQSFGWFFSNNSDKLFIGLQEDKEYFIKVTSIDQSPQFEGYTLSSRFVTDNPFDRYENNNNFEEAKNLPKEGKVTGNFGMPGDLDIFYLEPGTSDQLMGVTAKSVEPNISLITKAPKELFGPADLITIVLEDSNGNRELDGYEFEKQYMYDKGFFNQSENGSFMAKKHKGYFVLIADYFGFQTSLKPYELSVIKLNHKDEDAGSIMKSNIPTKPIALTLSKKSIFEKDGYLTPGVPYGDTDTYSFNLNSSEKTSIVLKTGEEIDGVVTVYNEKGQLIAEKDTYGKGDAENFILSLSKGKYYVKVRDFYKNSSSSPYKMKVTILK